MQGALSHIVHTLYASFCKYSPEDMHHVQLYKWILKVNKWGSVLNGKLNTFTMYTCSQTSLPSIRGKQILRCIMYTGMVARLGKCLLRHCST